MRGLDTNVLVRYLTLDDEVQAAAATEVIEGAARTGEPLFVSPVVLCEVVWVLEAAYRLGRSDILRTLDSILRTAQLHFEDKDVLWQALADYREGRGDFSDYVIGRGAVAAGCSSTVTFDRELTSSALFEVL
ncbi:MAG: PIN domain-containing protein [Longimicrobiales bacterium]